MTTFSTNLGLELIGSGEQTGTWGDTTNTNLGTLLEQAISGYVTQTITDGADTVITMPDGATGVARNMNIECTGTLTAARNLIVPAKRKLYFIYNNTSGGFAVTVKVSGQTGVSVPNGKKIILVNNGTDVVVAENYMAALSLGAALPVASGGSGQTSYTDGQLLIGNSTGNTLTKSTLTAGSGISITNGSGSVTIAATNSGTVTAVSGTAPVASSGGATPAISLNAAYGDTLNPYASKTANNFLAAPNGSAGVPTFRSIVAADVPTLNQNTTGTAAGLSSTLVVGSGGTGVTTTPSNGQLLIGNGTGYTVANLTAGTGCTINNTAGGITINATGTGGSVTSVGLSLPADFTVTNSPVTTTGTLTATYASQSANRFLASPNGSAGAPSYRAIVAADIPTLNQNTTGTAAGLSTTLAVASGGTGLTTTPANGALDIGNGTGFTRTTLTAGTGIAITNGAGSISIATTGGAAVTSVTGTSPVVSSGGTTPAISLASGYGDTQNPYASKTANYILAAPNGSAGVPTFRALAAADVPTLNQNTTGSAGSVVTNAIVSDTTSYLLMSPNAGSGTAQTPGTFTSLYFDTSNNTLNGANLNGSATSLASTLGIAGGGTGATTAQTAINALVGATTSGTYLRGNGTNAVMASLQAADLTGTVAVNRGGTGVATLTGLAYGNGTSAFTAATGSQIASAIGSATVTNATNASTLSTTNFSITESGGKLVFKYGATTIASLDSLGNFSTDAMYLNDQTIVADYTVPSTSNAGSFGPITIADGVTVTVPDPSTWSIV